MKKWLSLGLVPLIFCADALHADKRPTPLPGPWFTGPLITGSAYMLPKDNFNVEPYVYVIRNTAVYDENWKKQSISKFWSTQFQLPMQVGLTTWLETTVTPQVFHNRIDADPSLGLPAASSTQFADFSAQLGSSSSGQDRRLVSDHRISDCRDISDGEVRRPRPSKEKDGCGRGRRLCDELYSAL